MEEGDSVSRLLQASVEFLVPLRMARGFNQTLFDELCNAIKDFGRDWKERDVIPKAVAMLYVDAYTAMEACSYLYPAEGESIRQKADAMNDLIRGSCQ